MGVRWRSRTSSGAAGASWRRSSRPTIEGRSQADGGARELDDAVRVKASKDALLAAGAVSRRSGRAACRSSTPTTSARSRVPSGRARRVGASGRWHPARSAASRRRPALRLRARLEFGDADRAAEPSARVPPSTRPRGGRPGGCGRPRHRAEGWRDDARRRPLRPPVGALGRRSRLPADVAAGRRPARRRLPAGRRRGTAPQPRGCPCRRGSGSLVPASRDPARLGRRAPGGGDAAAAESRPRSTASRHAGAACRSPRRWWTPRSTTGARTSGRTGGSSTSWSSGRPSHDQPISEGGTHERGHRHAGHDPQARAQLIAQVQDISGPDLSTDTDEITNHDSPDGVEEFIPTIKRTGESRSRWCSCRPIPATTTTPGLAAWADRSKDSYVLEYPDGRSGRSRRMSPGSPTAHRWTGTCRRT